MYYRIMEYSTNIHSSKQINKKKRNLYDDGPQKEHKLLCFLTDKNTEIFY